MCNNEILFIIFDISYAFLPPSLYISVHLLVTPYLCLCTSSSRYLPPIYLLTHLLTQRPIYLSISILSPRAPHSRSPSVLYGRLSPHDTRRMVASARPRRAQADVGEGGCVKGACVFVRFMVLLGCFFFRKGRGGVW